MAIYNTRQGDVLDAICARHYEGRTDAFEQVLEANPVLAGMDPVLPAGIVLVLPVLAAVPVTSSLDLFG